MEKEDNPKVNIDNGQTFMAHVQVVEIQGEKGAG